MRSGSTSRPASSFGPSRLGSCFRTRGRSRGSGRRAAGAASAGPGTTRGVGPGGLLLEARRGRPGPGAVSGVYLCEFSVWIDSPRANRAVRPAPGMETSWSSRLTRCISTRRRSARSGPRARNRSRSNRPPELAVDPREQVEVEPGGHPLGVVVGGFEEGRVLVQVGPQEQPVGRVHAPGQQREQVDRLVGLVIAQAGAEEDEQLGPVEPLDHAGQGVAVVRRVAGDPEPGEGPDQRLGRLFEDRLARRRSARNAGRRRPGAPPRSAAGSWTSCRCPARPSPGRPAQPATIASAWSRRIASSVRVR